MKHERELCGSLIRLINDYEARTGYLPSALREARIAARHLRWTSPRKITPNELPGGGADAS